MNKIQLWLGLSGFVVVSVWFILNAPYMSEWGRGYWTGVLLSTLLILFGRFFEGVYAGWKEWKARKP